VNLLVVDASVAAKWCLPAKGETLTEDAFRLLQRYARGEIRFVVPDLFWAELANLLWKAVRQRRCAEADAKQALEAVRGYRLSTVASLAVLDLAFQIALTFDRTVYDSLYVALAVDAKAQLITADQRLANALAAQLPVKWLGGL